jgi:photosystem II stability/assembly factor-like uncharacterized protein
MHIALRICREVLSDEVFKESYGVPLLACAQGTTGIQPTTINGQLDTLMILPAHIPSQLPLHRLILCALMLIPLSRTPALPQWMVLHASGPSHEYHHIAAADSVDVVACGRTHYGVADNSFVRTSHDGGATWTDVLIDTLPNQTEPGVPPPGSYRKVAYPAPDMIVVASAGGYIRTSEDAGASWSEQHVDEGGLDFQSLDMWSRSVGVASTTGSVYLTDDGWKSWHPLMLPEGEATTVIHDLQMPAEHVILLTRGAGDRLFVLRSDDMGASWRATEGDPHAPYLTMVDPQFGVSVGFRRGPISSNHGLDLIQRTTDGGESWDTVLSREIYLDGGLETARFYDRRYGLAGGRFEKILMTTDGGSTWVQENNGLGAIHFTFIRGFVYLSRDIALAVTSNGDVIRREGAASVPAPPAVDAGERITTLVSGDDLMVSLEGLSRPHGDISLYDINGVECASKRFERTSDGKGSILFTMRLLPDGVYFIAVDGNEGWVVKKVIVRR